MARGIHLDVAHDGQTLFLEEHGVRVIGLR